VDPSHWNQTILNSSIVERNYTLSYNNSGNFKMTLLVCEYPEDIDSRRVAEATIGFKISEYLNGNIVITQDNGNGTWNGNGTTGMVVSSAKETNISLVFNDPSNYMSNATSIIYEWIINHNQTIINTENNTFAFNFTNPGIFTIGSYYIRTSVPN